MRFINLKYRTGFWKYVSPGRYVIIAGAIFFLFSEIGFISDLVSKGSFTETGLFVNVVYTGLVGVLYFYTFTKNFKALPLTILYQVLVGLYAWNGTNHMSSTSFQARAAFDGYAILVSIVLGYLLFIVFITFEGIRNLRYRIEMNLAHDLHSSLVPKVDLRKNGFEVYGVSKPTDEVGGDLIDVIDNGGATVCYIADVSGHGVAAGSMMGMFKSAVRVLLNANKSLESILAETTKTLHYLRKKDMFLTCAFLKFNSNHTVEFSTAGHLPILRLRDDSAAFEELVIKQLPIAATDSFVYNTELVEFGKGDLFVLLTDGITETADRSQNEFGLQLVKEIIIKNRNQPLIDMYTSVDKKVSAFGKQKDDQTVLLVRCLQ